MLKLSYYNIIFILYVLCWQNAATYAIETSNDSPLAAADQVDLSANNQKGINDNGDDELVIVEADEAKVQEEPRLLKCEWKSVTDSQGIACIDVGSKFPVSICSSHTSKTAKIGDSVEATLGADIKIDDKLIAAKDSKIVGHVFQCKPARKLLHARFSTDRWMRASGTIGIQFDEIITGSGERLSLNAVPARQPKIVENPAEGRVLGVNQEGEIVSPLSIQMKALALHHLCKIGGPWGKAAAPLVMSVAGAVNPSFAYMRPVGTNVKHRRLKGFLLGATSGLPAGTLIVSSIIKGPESIIIPGDQFLVELKQPFNGQSINTAIATSVNSQVHGKVISESKDTSVKEVDDTQSEKNLP